MQGRGLGGIDRKNIHAMGNNAAWLIRCLNCGLTYSPSTVPTQPHMLACWPWALMSRAQSSWHPARRTPRARRKAPAPKGHWLSTNDLPSTANHRSLTAINRQPPVTHCLVEAAFEEGLLGLSTSFPGVGRDRCTSSKSRFHHRWGYPRLQEVSEIPFSHISLPTHFASTLQVSELPMRSRNSSSVILLLAYP